MTTKKLIIYILGLTRERSRAAARMETLGPSRLPTAILYIPV